MVCRCKYRCGALGRNRRGCSCQNGGSHICLGLLRLAEAGLLRPAEEHVKNENGKENNEENQEGEPQEPEEGTDESESEDEWVVLNTTTINEESE